MPTWSPRTSTIKLRCYGPPRTGTSKLLVEKGADLGSNIGGFVDCLLQSGAAKVYAIDTGYGALDWKLRKDSRVVVMERTNAMHAALPQRKGRPSPSSRSSQPK